MQRGVQVHKKLRIGLVGCGSIARTHLSNLRDISQAEPWAYMDIRLDAARSYLEHYGGAYACDDMERVIHDPDIDIILVASPDKMHADHALHALEAGKHLFLEKPLATTLSDALRVQEAVRNAAVKFMVDLKFRFAPAVQAARRFVPAPVMVLGQAVGDPIPAGHWRHNPNLSAGVIYDLGPHLFDLIYYLCGEAEPVRIYAEASALQYPDSPLINNLITTFCFANGARAVATIGVAGQSGFASKWLLQSFGGDCNATVHGHAQEITVRKADGKPIPVELPVGGSTDGEPIPVELPVDRSTDSDLKLALASFINAVVEDTKPPIGIEDAVRVTRMIEAALLAAADGRPVALLPANEISR